MQECGWANLRVGGGKAGGREGFCSFASGHIYIYIYICSGSKHI
jgi:hypothetical protein